MVDGRSNYLLDRLWLKPVWWALPTLLITKA
jgi:hypothetical protein